MSHFVKISHFLVTIFYVIYQNFKKKTAYELNFEGVINSILPTNGMPFDYMIRLQIKNAIVQLSRGLPSQNVMVRHIRMKQNHSYMSRYVITWSLDQNRRVHLFHFTRSNHAKVTKATAPKFGLMNGTHSYRTHYLWLCHILINEKLLKHYICVL